MSRIGFPGSGEVETQSKQGVYLVSPCRGRRKGGKKGGTDRRKGGKTHIGTVEDGLLEHTELTLFLQSGVSGPGLRRGASDCQGLGYFSN